MLFYILQLLNWCISNVIRIYNYNPYLEDKMECPICYDEIGSINVVTTECGHQFHCNCLMRSAALNGFGCPI